MFAAAGIGSLNIMGLASANSCSVVGADLQCSDYSGFDLLLTGVKFRPLTANQLLQQNIPIYGLGVWWHRLLRLS